MLRLRAPAKLNLYLRVLGQRADGYHELETVFERIDLADELTFEAQPHGLTLTCSEPSLSCAEDNLVLKAARVLQRMSQTTPGVRLHLIKRIPIAAGLGGGSSDAATTLLGLNELWALGWDRARLIELAAQVGSDAPFFLSQAPFAIGRGRGEVCESILHTFQLAHILVVPEAHLSTREVYEGAQFDLTAPRPSVTMMAHALSNGSPGELARGLWNDLQPEAIRRCPVIALIQSRLRDLGCLGSLVSGSGPAVFGLCRDPAHARDVAMRLRRESAPWRIEIIQTDNPSLVVTPAD